VLDDDALLLAARAAEIFLDTFLFAGTRIWWRHVMVNGDWVVRDFHHRDKSALHRAIARSWRRLGPRATRC